MIQDRLQLLRDRSAMLAAARQFFYARNVLEVDCPHITEAASVDAHIDLIPTQHPTGNRYLHSSPEYAMKQLLVEGIGDIFQLSHVFRQEESGTKHNPEFMMAEWYRLGFSFEEMVEETVDFIRLFLGPLPSQIKSYQKVFLEYVGIDPFLTTKQELLEFLQMQEIPLYAGIEHETKDDLLNILLGMLIEPDLGQNELLVLAYYPSTQAALAKTRLHPEGVVAERFEIYYRGMELCNGYHELADAEEQRKRLLEANEQRVRLGKEMLPIDEEFLKALEMGLPDCCGVAVGFDRLMMLRHNQNSIKTVMALPHNHHQDN